MKRSAICLGLTRLDPAAYNGWDGQCPGSDIDAFGFAALCHSVGFDGVSVLLNASVTTDVFEPVFDEVCASLDAGDLFVLYNSGHGGQVPDEDGDEEDGNDETLCWWNGEILDDTIGDYLSRIPAGVHSLLVFDTCSSGTMYRGVTRRGRVACSNPIVLEKSVASVQSDIICFSGCDDGRYSLGSERGGLLTLALQKTASRARRPISYHQWFNRAAKLMPREQVPVFTSFGNEDFPMLEMLT